MPNPRAAQVTRQEPPLNASGNQKYKKGTEQEQPGNRLGPPLLVVYIFHVSLTVGVISGSTEGRTVLSSDCPRTQHVSESDNMGTLANRKRGPLRELRVVDIGGEGENKGHLMGNTEG